ncbi:DUF4406 domain-containing protein [Streptomyces sp. GZWMJZ-114]|uniref:DUF7768 domain-containing protein n=1 Tax=Streptomyces sp. GZWMJZ-114 TaxID=2494734 RepID=UPI0010101B23|nr:DUF4406 domain-containing protein [Streptomyces sp. GZWMJZ-114]
MHPATLQFNSKPVVFTAHAAESAYLRENICAFVLQQDRVPVNPFMAFGYFLFGLVEKDAIRAANNNMLMRCDELWVFGEASDGVDVEVAYARDAGMPVRWFDVDHYGEKFVERKLD